MKKLWLLLLMLPFPFLLMADTQEPAKLLAEFSFSKYLGGIVLLQGQIEAHKDTLNFILDTGSGGISLDSSTCERLQIENRLTDTFLAGIGEKRRVRFAFNKKLKMGGMTIDSLDFHINDYSLLTHVDGRKIDGVIGYSFLKRFIVAIDYENSLIRIYSPGKMEYPKNGYAFKPKLNTVPIQNGVVMDRNSFEGDFYFDLGAKMELVFSKRFVTENKVFLKRRKHYLIGVEGVGGKEQMQVSVVKKLVIGPYTFKNVPTYVYDDVHNVTNYPQNFGLIGSGIYSKFNLILNFPNKEIFMKPNSSFDAPFDYSYTGLSIYAKEERCLIYDVSPDSPAEMAGLRSDDEIVSIDNISYSNVQGCRNALAKKNAFVVLHIKRGSQFLFCLMKTSSII
jgi:predicted aspartyl protease